VSKGGFVEPTWTMVHAEGELRQEGCCGKEPAVGAAEAAAGGEAVPMQDTAREKQRFVELFARSPHGIVKRVCLDCAPSHQLIYYRRLHHSEKNLEEEKVVAGSSSGGSSFNIATCMLDTWQDQHNKFHIDFDLFSTYADARLLRNAWQWCNFNDRGIAFPRDCAPTASHKTEGQWQSTIRAGGAQHFALYVELPAVPPPLATAETGAAGGATEGQGREMQGQGHQGEGYQEQGYTRSGGSTGSHDSSRWTAVDKVALLQGDSEGMEGGDTHCEVLDVDLLQCASWQS
jgi:hypothetical protein